MRVVSIIYLSCPFMGRFYYIADNSLEQIGYFNDISSVRVVCVDKVFSQYKTSALSTL